MTGPGRHRARGAARSSSSNLKFRRPAASSAGAQLGPRPAARILRHLGVCCGELTSGTVTMGSDHRHCRIQKVPHSGCPTRQPPARQRSPSPLPPTPGDHRPALGDVSLRGSGRRCAWGPPSPARTVSVRVPELSQASLPPKDLGKNGPGCSDNTEHAQVHNGAASPAIARTWEPP